MKQIKRGRAMLAGVGLLLATTSAQASVFSITMNFGTGLTTEQQGYFTQAEQFWESIITGYAANVTQSFLSTYIQDVVITASGVDLGGPGGTLGSGGPTFFPANVPGSGGYAFATSGDMLFDLADISNMISTGKFLDVIKHEMAHVLGFGTLWNANNLYVDGSGQYTGQFGLAAYKSEFGQANASYVPVELSGGNGTAGGHWNEVDNGSGNTGISAGAGFDMHYELMTGWINSPTFLSNTTIQSFRDLGYTVAQVPLPAAAWLFMGGLFSLLGLRKTRHHA